MVYVAGFVVAVPEQNRELYARNARAATPLFQEFGAQRIVECWGDDVPTGEVTDFYRSVKAEPGEVIVFAWHEYADKAAAQAANEKMMSDPRMQIGDDAGFDAKRMIYGNFDVIIDAGAGGTMGYIDGALIAVPASQKEEYIRTSKLFPPLFMEYGATRVVDAWGDEVPAGVVTDFPRAVNASPDEVVVFSWIEWPDKATRDAAWPKLFGDERMSAIAAPYDESRRVWGGFVPIVTD